MYQVFRLFVMLSDVFVVWFRCNDVSAHKSEKRPFPSPSSFYFGLHDIETLPCASNFMSIFEQRRGQMANGNSALQQRFSANLPGQAFARLGRHSGPSRLSGNFGHSADSAGHDISIGVE